MAEAARLMWLNYYSLFCALALYVGETVVVITDKTKPFSLSADDYLVATGLLLFAWRPFTHARLAGLAACWGLGTGNLRVMLIYRIDGGGERLGLLIAALVASVLGLLATAWVIKQRAAV